MKRIVFIISLILGIATTAFANPFTEDVSIKTNSWWRIDLQGVQYGLSDERMAQVFADEDGDYVRMLRPGTLLVYCFLPNGDKRTVTMHITGDPYDGSLITSNYKEECLRIVNQFRTSQGRRPLRLSEELNADAQTRAEELVAYYNHVRPDGQPFYTVIGSYSISGENIAKGVPSAEEVVNAWIDSPEHRENILNPDFTEMGIAVHIDLLTRDCMFWAQLFRG